MGFTALAPAVRVKSGVFKVSTIKPRRDGDPWGLSVTVPSVEFAKRFGTAATFNLLLGHGADEGKLMIQPAEGGAFKPAALRNCFVFRLPASDTWPSGAFVADDPERVTRDGALIVTLPEWAWNKERQKAIALARAHVAAGRKAER